jgi:DUF4097 and DUF4098 domain-containing protein YvlB
MLPRRFRVDFDVQVPAGLGVEVAQAKGDVDGTVIAGDLAVSVASGDIAAQRIDGSVTISAAKGDVTIQGTGGAVAVDVKHGDLTLREIGGRATASTMHGDIAVSAARSDVTATTMHGKIEMESVAGRVVGHTKHGDITLARPAGPVSLDLQAVRGDVAAAVDLFIPGSSSTISVMSGDISVRLGDQVRCRIAARVTSGELDVEGPLSEVQRGRRTLEGVLGAPEARLDLSAVSGDVAVNVRRLADQPRV